MKKLGPTGQRWLKGFHLFFACLWVGASLAMLNLQIFYKPASPDGLNTIHTVLSLLNFTVVIPAAMACLITGLLMSVFTNWGFFKHYWVLIKWIATPTMILFGTFVLGPWAGLMQALARSEGLKALQNQTYLSYRSLTLAFGLILLGVLIFMIFMSTLKPWGQRGKGASKTD